MLNRSAIAISAVIPALAILVVMGSAAAETCAASQKAAGQIFDATGVKGGLVVHLGCGDGKLTAALGANDSYTVHGLDTDPANVAKAREHVRSAGLYGRVSIDRGPDGKTSSFIFSVGFMARVCQSM